MPDIWDNVSFVTSSKYRVLVLKTLSENPATPSQIAELNDINIAHVSRALQELRSDEDTGLVTLLVDEETSKGRIYRATETGEETWDTIESAGLHEQHIE